MISSGQLSLFFSFSVEIVLALLYDFLECLPVSDALDS